MRPYRTFAASRALQYFEEVARFGPLPAARVSSTFEQLGSAISEMVGTGSELIRIAVCSAFGPSWLVPRIANRVEASGDDPRDQSLRRRAGADAGGR